MMKVYSGVKGFAVTLFFVAGLILFFSVLCWGISKAAELFLPLLIVISYLLIIVFLLGILPASVNKEFRPKLALNTVLIAQVLGVSTWMMSFFFVIKNYGAGAIFFALLFQFLAPIAIAGALVKGSWGIAGHLSAWIVFTYGMRWYAQWMLKPNPARQENRRIIDVDAVEVQGH